MFSFAGTLVIFPQLGIRSFHGLRIGWWRVGGDSSVVLSVLMVWNRLMWCNKSPHFGSYVQLLSPLFKIISAYLNIRSIGIWSTYFQHLYSYPHISSSLLLIYAYPFYAFIKGNQLSYIHIMLSQKCWLYIYIVEYVCVQYWRNTFNKAIAVEKRKLLRK